MGREVAGTNSIRREQSTQCQQDSDTTDEYKEKNKAAMLDKHGSR